MGMNPRVLLTPLLIATLTFSIPSLSANEAELDGFKREVAALKAEVKAKFPAVAEDSAAAVAFSRAMMKKIAAVKADAMPDDLKQAWAGLTTYAQKFNALFHDWPSDNAKLRAFIKTKTKDDPGYMDRFGDQMLKLSSEAGDAMDKLEEVARKYGIDPEGLIPGQAAAREFSEP